MSAWRKPWWPVAALSGTVAAVLISAVPPTAPPARAADRTTAPVPARYAHQQLHWQPCAAKPSLECARMTVPRDWHHPGTGADLTIGVSRHRATGPARRRGVLMMAAGGPGASGLTRPADFVARSPSVGAAYDVVGFDQRGVGSSTPAQCQTDAEFREFYAHDFRDRSPAALRGVLARSRQLVAGCLRHSGDLVRRLTTDQAVRDMDLFRALLGVRKISYYGPSYATWLGAYYATEFPQRIERAVLDSNEDFSGTWQHAQGGLPKSFQRRFEQDFLPWIARYDTTYHYGRTAAAAKARWEARRRALHERPLTVGTLTIGPNQLDNLTIQSMYNARQFPQLAAALRALDHWPSTTPAERTRVAKLFASYLSPGFAAVYSSVTCNDTPWRGDLDYWLDRSAKDAAAYPLVGARELAYAATCAAWPVSDAPHVHVTGRGLPTTLMLNSVRDPATYYEGARAAHRALRGSRLVTVTGGGDHGQYQNGNACVDGIVNAYLLGETAPDHDVTCAADPLPVPAGRVAPSHARRTRSSVLRSAAVPAIFSWTPSVRPAARPGAL
ncbi:TAP-like protein [Streptomyces sp. 2112.3]|uniref:alpha/beta hydrolase n=1 Tax=Streptomyces sp. 2112.3 TaxID=1881023 RepID=UPI0008968EB5|nr:alpha/beta fold hydrolase [Streptomyces sp. 2112.3]SED37564.1 TAP-like protein [Streptomyces sp. 2112.3]